MSQKRPKSDLDSVTNVLQSLLQNSKFPLSEQFKRWRLWKNWDKIVGPNLCKGSEPVDYLQGTLTIWVKSSTHMQEMNYLTNAIRDRVNEFFDETWVRQIRFTLKKSVSPEENLQKLDKILK